MGYRQKDPRLRGPGFDRDTEELSGHKEVGVVHGIEKKNILHTDIETSGNGGEGIAATDGVEDWFRGNHHFHRLFLWLYSWSGFVALGKRRTDQGRRGRRKIGKAVIEQ